jgi:hypothetical protein
MKITEAISSIHRGLFWKGTLQYSLPKIDFPQATENLDATTFDHFLMWHPLMENISI